MKRLLFGLGAAILGTGYWMRRNKGRGMAQSEQGQAGDKSFLRMDASGASAGPEEDEIQGAGEVAREF